MLLNCYFFFSSRRRHTRCLSDWSSDVCSSDLIFQGRSKWREGNRCAASFLPHQIAREEQRHGLKAAFGESVSLRDALFNGCGGVEGQKRNVHGAKERLGDVAALRLPGIAFPEGAAIGDEH